MGPSHSCRHIQRPGASFSEERTPRWQLVASNGDKVHDSVMETLMPWHPCMCLAKAISGQPGAPHGPDWLPGVLNAQDAASQA